jgi:hypothetical protein
VWVLLEFWVFGRKVWRGKPEVEREGGDVLMVLMDLG